MVAQRARFFDRRLTEATRTHRNEDTFAAESARADLDAEGWCDPGERAATLALADRVRGGRVLDIGTGTGRTTSLLRLLTDDYVGIDYVPEMVAIARQRHPSVDLRVADARDLSTFGNAEFDLVTFSYNGIDAADHDQRQLMLTAFHRVLRPGGVLMFSTLNADGPAARERPWRLNPSMAWRIGSLLPAKRTPLRQLVHLLLSLARSPGGPVREMRNWLRLARQQDHGPNWDIAPMAAHEYGLLVHFTRPPEIRRELSAHHFAVEQIVGSDNGDVLAMGQDTSPDWWYHVIATATPAS